MDAHGWREDLYALLEPRIEAIRASLDDLLRAARELWIPRRNGSSDDDESVWDFAARRLGRDFADRLIHPMALGIFAGDAKRLPIARKGRVAVVGDRQAI